MPEQFDSVTPDAQPTSTFGFSGAACELLGATIKDYLERGGVPDALAQATARLCREAQERGLLAACPLTTTDRAALVALAIDECVHAFYRDQLE